MSVVDDPEGGVVGAEQVEMLSNDGDVYQLLTHPLHQEVLKPHGVWRTGELEVVMESLRQKLITRQVAAEGCKEVSSS